MKRYTFKHKNGNIHFNQISENDIMVWQEWNEDSDSNAIVLKITDLQRFAKVIFKISRQFESEQALAASQPPTYPPIIIPNISIPQQKASSTMEKVKRLHPKAYAPWSPEEENLMVWLFQQGMNIANIAAYLNRNEGGIRSRLKKLGLIY